MSYVKNYTAWKKDPISYWKKKAKNITWMKQFEDVLKKTKKNTFMVS